MNLTRYLVQRIVGAIVVMLGVMLTIFVLLRLTGDPVSMFISPMASREDYLRTRQQLGLDEPLPIQYLKYVQRVAVGDFGNSYQRSEPAMGIVLERVPATIRLALVTLAILIGLALPIGVAGAVYRGSWLDTQLSALTLVAQSLPNYWAGIMFVLIFSVGLRLFPTSGTDGWQSIILPALTLALQPCSRLARLLRSELIDVLEQDYIRTARAKGLGRIVVLSRHALRNAAIPLVTILALDIGYLLGGAIIVETIFAWPGLGSLMVQSMNSQDFPVIQASVLLIAGTVVAISVLMDLVYVWLDPRVRLR
jgi:peptide/nickel transport system permease protein